MKTLKSSKSLEGGMYIKSWGKLSICSGKLRLSLFTRKGHTGTRFLMRRANFTSMSGEEGSGPAKLEIDRKDLRVLLLSSIPADKVR